MSNMFDGKYIENGVNRFLIPPRLLLGFLPCDLKEAICSSLDVESLEDDSLVFDYDCIRDCFSVSKSFEVIVNVKNEV